ncbi:hypothetical protein FN846DRAFT_885620 [Sphaerosporella brunnea]|uniref:Uncharacterized protein n=1 Tax=Sphaerosporella brunnea TaxID=1250544 RepID=A0A5J5FAW6_9PEZI|nr:hypothetical protein FN846DRAFT_885620 [Sphaerosporella brunnea]
MVGPTRSSKQSISSSPGSSHLKRSRTDVQDLLNTEEHTPKRKCEDLSEVSSSVPLQEILATVSQSEKSPAHEQRTSPLTTAMVIDWYRKAPNCIENWNAEDYQWKMHNMVRKHIEFKGYWISTSKGALATICIIGTVAVDNLYLSESGQYGYGLILSHLSDKTIATLSKFMMTFPKAEGNDPVAGKTPFSKDGHSLKINCSFVDVYGKTTSFDKDNTIGREFLQSFPEVKDARSAVEMSSTGPKNGPSSGSEVRSGQLVAVAAHLRAYQPDWKKATEWGYSLKLNSILILQDGENCMDEQGEEDTFSF